MLSFESLDETPLPEHIRAILEEGGFDTPLKILEAPDEDLLGLKGIGRRMLGTIRAEVRTELDKALDAFYAVGHEYFKSFRTDYPANSVVLQMQQTNLKVKDFLMLYTALRNIREGSETK